MVSPYDPDARFGIKRDTRWTGYKVHLAERDLTPREPLVDTGYVDAELLVTSRTAHQMELLGSGALRLSTATGHDLLGDDGLL
jgi:hypothetical protein